MARITWDNVGDRFFETGVDRGVLFPIKTNGDYDVGVAWNGLTSVSESPSGAEITDFWADNIKYASVRSVEEFGATVEAYTYPEEFAACDGSATLATGLYIGQQTRQKFGITYRTTVNNDVGLDAASNYKVHIVYGASAAPSEKAYATINDSPEAITFSWELSTTAVPVTGYRPTASLIVDSTKTDPVKLAALEDVLYGTSGVAPRLPLPDEVSAIIAGDAVVPAAPTFVPATGILTIVATANVIYNNADTGAVLSTGAQTALPGGQYIHVVANPVAGYYIETGVVRSWMFISTKE